MPKLPTPREVAFDVALAVEKDGAYANVALPAALQRVELSDRDRAFATELLYGSLRAQGEIDAVIQEATHRSPDSLDPEVRVLLRLGAYQILWMRVESHAAVDESVRLTKSRGLHRVTGLANAALRAVASHSREYWSRVIGQSTTSLHSHPSWIAAAVEAALAECDGEGELQDALEAHNQAPLVTLCHLPGLSVPDDDSRTPYSPVGAFHPRGNPGGIPGVIEHTIRVQDEGSQLAALLLSRVAPLARSDQVWDMCAGPGGKTALLGADALAVGATVHASEVSAHRARLVEDSIAALSGLHPGSVTVDVKDAREPCGERYSRILLDAPCSGLGALRRRPEARWVKKPDMVPGLVALQEELLRNGLNSLAPGGVLAYVTCSPVVEETTELVSRALEGDERFRLMDTPAVLETIVRTPIQGHRRGSAVQLWTHRHGTDAMFIQLIERSPSVG